MIEIEICERLMDSWVDHNGDRQPKYHAQLKDHPGIWGCGRTQSEAVGDVIRSHPERFGLQLNYLDTKAR